MERPTPIICLMGPTASGKTPLAIELVQRYPLKIISVDSAMVYKGMDIGTAKPTHEELQIAPHRLIDLVDPAEPYSAGQFRLDALAAMKDIIANGQIPFLVGGTMLYFRVLQQGLAELPQADASLRANLQARMAQEGVEEMHRLLTNIDPIASARIHPNDSQRIQRALEVWMLTGKTITYWQEETQALSHYQFINLALMPTDRALLHQRIAERFLGMVKRGFLDEAEHLFKRGDLSTALPSLRSVGYRQAFDYFEGKLTLEEMKEKAIIATRQLAKRQMTWLRSWEPITYFDPADSPKIEAFLHPFL